MQYQGTLADADLASLLKAVQTERATGTLSVESQAGSASLYFLFGHLLHAAGSEAEGEEVVIDALLWNDGNYQFDPRAKLPFEETIKASTADLIEEAERRRQDGGVAVVTAPAPETAPALEEPPAVTVPPEPGDAWAGVISDTTVIEEQAQPPAMETPPAAQEEPQVTTKAPEPAYTNGSGTAVLQQPAAKSGPEQPHPLWNRRATDAAPLGDLFPLPAGRPVYERLKSAIVYFPKLMATLRSDRHTGYLRLEGEGFQGILLLHDGHLLEALYKDGQLYNNSEAFQKVRQRMEAGEGACDLIELTGETVIALGQLLMARPRYTGLLGRFVQFSQLLEHLGEDKVDGSVVVSGADDTGVILLRRGAVLGSYTNQKRELVTDHSRVDALAAESGARIEVKGGMGEISGIDVEQLLR